MKFIVLGLCLGLSINLWAVDVDTVGVNSTGLSTYFNDGDNDVYYWGNSKDDFAGVGSRFTGSNNALEWNLIFGVEPVNSDYIDVSENPYLETLIENTSDKTIELVFDIKTSSTTNAEGTYYQEKVLDSEIQYEYYRTRIILQPYQKDTFIINYTGAITYNFLSDSEGVLDLRHVESVYVAALPSGYPNSWSSQSLDLTTIEVTYLKMGSYVDYKESLDYKPFGVEDIVVCDRYESLEGDIYTESQQLSMLIDDSNGNDSLAIVDIQVNKATYRNDVIVECDSYTWIDGVEYVSSNSTSSFLLTNAVGCDSIVSLDLSIYQSVDIQDTITECGSSYTWSNGLTYSSDNNSAEQLLKTKYGCDSLVTLNLKVNQASVAYLNIESCDTFTWLDGVEYTESQNGLSYTLTNSVGCDSVITLDLIIKNSPIGNDIVTSCGSFTWIDGVKYTESTNTASFTLVGGANNGCDSIVNLDLTIELSDLVTLSESGLAAVEEGQTYQWVNCDNNSDNLQFSNDQDFEVLTEGSYAVIISGNGCEVTSDCFEVLLTGVSNDFTYGQEFTVYPNPTSGNVVIDLEDNSKAELYLFDINGKKMISKLIYDSNLELELEGVPSGIYFIQIQQNGKQGFYKFIKI